MLAKKPKGATQKRKSSSASGLLWMFVGAVLTVMIGAFIYLSPIFDFSPAGSEAAADPNKQIQPRVNTDTDNADYEFYDILPNQEMATIPDEDISETDSDPSISISDFEPDVVVTQPNSNAENRSDNTDNTNNVDNTSSESGRNNSAANSTSSNDITIVEENATYDGTTPSNTASARANTSTANVQRAQNAATYILQINSFGDADEADRRRAQVLMAGVDARVVKNTTGNGLPIYQVISRSMNNRQAVTSAQQRLQNNGIDSIIVEQRR